MLVVSSHDGRRLARRAALRKRAALLLTLIIGSGATAACSVGVGEGTVQGSLTLPQCSLDNAAYSLRPTFFGGDVLDVDDQIEIRVQRGGNHEGFSDGLRFLVRDSTMIRTEMLGAPIALRNDDGLIELNMYLNESCPVEFDRVPINLEAMSGTITFTSLYAPEVSKDDVVTEATFDAELIGSEGETATLTGSFRFLFNRGRPAQRYP